MCAVLWLLLELYICYLPVGNGVPSEMVLPYEFDPQASGFIWTVLIHILEGMEIPPHSMSQLPSTYFA